METLIELLKKLENTKFYGELSIKFEHGKVMFIRKTENIKPDKNGEIPNGIQESK